MGNRGAPATAVNGADFAVDVSQYHPHGMATKGRRSCADDSDRRSCTGPMDRCLDAEKERVTTFDEAISTYSIDQRSEARASTHAVPMCSAAGIHQSCTSGCAVAQDGAVEVLFANALSDQYEAALESPRENGDVMFNLGAGKVNPNVLHSSSQITSIVEPTSSRSSSLASPKEGKMAIGCYVITQLTNVTASLDRNSEQLAILEAGTRVTVVDIVNCVEDHRIRGRISSPHNGFVSLINTETGFPFARAVALEEISAKYSSRDTFVALLDISEHMPLGLRCEFNDGKTFRVKRINSPGAAETWNSKNPYNKFEENSRILEVNGVRDDADRMLEEFRKTGVCRLLVKRAPLDKRF